MLPLAARPIFVALLALFAIGFDAGCCTHSHTLRLASLHSPNWIACADWAAAEAQLGNADELEAADNEGCVAAYFSASWLAWQAIIHEPAEAHAATCRGVYNTSVAKLLASAQRFGRLDAARGLVIDGGNRTQTVPVIHYGFAWLAADFQRLHPPPAGHVPLLSRRYGCSGIGVGCVVERNRNPCNGIEARFFPEKSFFAATAVLRFCAEAVNPGEPTAVLEFHNPLEVRSIASGGQELPLAADLSAPLAKTLEEAPRTYLAGFIEPGGATTTARLGFLEPYQPGKVPVVLIHGLFSDPQSWADLINDLRAAPGFAQRYQLWVFRYPTGQGFLQSAATFRTELRAAIAQLDSSGSDPALRSIVLVGHSMGGLIAKLQVTYSDELVWSRLANRPLEQIITTEPTRAWLAETCYFDPTIEVSRVVFIASPHCGSLCSSAMIGKGAALLVEPSPQQAALHQQLIRDNPETFNPMVERRFPTSIDMLTPSSPLLEAMQQMRLRPGVRLHNIVGVSHPVSLDGPSDGVVSVHSASHPGSDSTLAINAPHTKVHQTLATSAEILRILACHQSSQGRRSAAPLSGPPGRIPERVHPAVPQEHSTSASN
jgi:pimeloyl-ACP methyl ester carboxylesterase